MEIVVNENKKIVEVWLSNEEKNNAFIKDELKKLYDLYKKTKYIVAIYESGNADLLSGTQSLLSQNRDISSPNQVL